MGVGVQRGGAGHMAQDGGQHLDVHPVGQGVGGEGMPQIMETKVRESCCLQQRFHPVIGSAGAGGLFRPQRVREYPLSYGRLLPLPEKFRCAGRQDDGVRVPAAVLVSHVVSSLPLS